MIPLLLVLLFGSGSEATWVSSFPVSYPANYHNLNLTAIGLKETPIRARHLPLLELFEQGEPHSGHCFAELRGEIGGEKPEVLGFRISQRFFRLSEEDRVSVLNHELTHFNDLQNKRLHGLLISLPPEIRTSVLEYRAYVSETIQVEWAQCSLKYRKGILQKAHQLKAEIEAWVESKKPFGRITLQSLQKDHSPKMARKLFRTAKSQLISVLIREANAHLDQAT